MIIKKKSQRRRSEKIHQFVFMGKLSSKLETERTVLILIKDIDKKKKKKTLES